jgi:hypothetical protein
MQLLEAAMPWQSSTRFARPPPLIHRPRSAEPAATAEWHREVRRCLSLTRYWAQCNRANVY